MKRALEHQKAGMGDKNGGGHTHRGKVTQVSYLSIDK